VISAIILLKKRKVCFLYKSFSYLETILNFFINCYLAIFYGFGFSFIEIEQTT